MHFLLMSIRSASKHIAQGDLTVLLDEQLVKSSGTKSMPGAEKGGVDITKYTPNLFNRMWRTFLEEYSCFSVRRALPICAELKNTQIPCQLYQLNFQLQLLIKTTKCIAWCNWICTYRLLKMRSKTSTYTPFVMI